MQSGARMLGDEEKRLLIGIAISAIRQIVAGETENSELLRSAPSPDYNGAFVTVHIDDDLRGCIGYLAPIKPMPQAVRELAQTAATEDMRFAPIRAVELPGLSVEITLLEPMEEIGGPADIVIGEHGVYIERDLRRGILLPQVASERGWTAEEFLEAVCDKARLHRNAWKEPGTVLQRFGAELFSSKDYRNYP